MSVKYRLKLRENRLLKMFAKKYNFEENVERISRNNFNENFRERD